jgi:hypothetical protein
MNAKTLLTISLLFNVILVAGAFLTANEITKWRARAASQHAALYQYEAALEEATAYLQQCSDMYVNERARP